MAPEMKTDNDRKRALDLEIAVEIFGWTRCVPTGIDFHGVKYPDIFGPYPSYTNGLSLPRK